MKIVVGDPDRALLEMLQIRLSVAGYEPYVARTGPAVLDLVRQIRPAAAILECALPGLDGFGVIEEVLMQRTKLPFEVMMMSRQLSPADIRRAGALGVKTCIAKPFSGADMLDRVARVLGQPARAMKQVVWV